MNDQKKNQKKKMNDHQGSSRAQFTLKKQSVYINQFPIDRISCPNTESKQVGYVQLVSALRYITQLLNWPFLSLL